MPFRNVVCSVHLSFVLFNSHCYKRCSLYLSFRCNSVFSFRVVSVMLSTESFYCIGALFISTISCMRNFLCFMFYPKLVLVKTYAFGKMKKYVFLSLSFFFQSKSPCCLLVTSPSLVLWNITSNIITTHIMTRSEMWLLSSKRRTYRSQIWSLRLSAKTCIATSTEEGSLFRWIQVLTLSQR